MYKRVLKIKCKISSTSSDKDFRLTNVKVFHKMMKILCNICLSGKLFTAFIIKGTLPFPYSNLLESFDYEFPSLDIIALK